jgi:hypothetical protein
MWDVSNYDPDSDLKLNVYDYYPVRIETENQYQYIQYHLHVDL